MSDLIHHETAGLDMITHEANLLCWVLANEIDTTTHDTKAHNSQLANLSAMLLSVTQLLVGRGYPLPDVVSALNTGLQRMEENKISLELADAVQRFEAMSQEVLSSALSRRQGVMVTHEEKACLNE